MEFDFSYPIPAGLHAIPAARLDLRPDNEVDHVLQQPRPVTSDKNIWFFWHKGYMQMHPYAKRTVRAWHRRFSKLGWEVRILDRLPGSALNVAEFLDTSDPIIFPRAFRDGTIGGDYAPQHTSDLVRWPLLLRYGGVYADVGLMQIGDLDRLWNETVGNPDSRYEVMSYNAGSATERNLTNYFLASKRDNPLFKRCQRLFLALWAADGGKESTDGMHKSPLLKGVPMMGAETDYSFVENGRRYDRHEVSRLLTDYIIQGQVMTMVMSLIDEEDGWDGPRYAAENIYAIEYMEGSQLINVFTSWDGPRAFELLSLSLPNAGEDETPKQGEAREVVEGCLSRSFGFKLAHGLILRVVGETLGSLWRKHDGSDNVPRTYAHWLRYGMIHWTQDQLPPAMMFKVERPIKVGPLLQET